MGIHKVIPDSWLCAAATPEDLFLGVCKYALFD
jgi:hypothetical protein